MQPKIAKPIFALAILITLAAFAVDSFLDADFNGGYTGSPPGGVSIADDDVSLDGNLIVEGTSTLEGALALNGALTLAGDLLPDADSTRDLGATGTRWAEIWGDALTLTDNAAVGGTLGVTGVSTLSDITALSVGGGYGSTGITGTAAGALSINGALVVDTTSTLSGTTQVGGGAGSTGIDLTDAGNIEADGTLIIDGASTLSGNVGVGTSGSARGVMTINEGGGSNTPGVLVLEDLGGVLWYLWASEAGQLRIHSALPTADSDGSAIGP